jgi:hypothetical protein
MPTICTMEVKDNLFIGGGMKGEIICKVVRSSSPSTSFPILDIKKINHPHMVTCLFTSVGNAVSGS